MSTAFILINCDLGAEDSIIEELHKIDSVKEVHGTFGAYDIVAKVEDDKKEKIREIITWNIRNIPKIRTTLTLLESDSMN